MSLILIYRNEKQYGPYTTEEVSAYMSAGNIQKNDLFWMEDMKEWRKISVFGNTCVVDQMEASTKNDQTQPSGITNPCEQEINSHTFNHNVSNIQTKDQSNSQPQPITPPEIIDPKIRTNLSKCTDHISLLCLECGYKGLMGVISTKIKYRYWILIFAIPGILDHYAFFTRPEFAPLPGGKSFIFPLWYYLVLGVIIALWFRKKTKVYFCPNCEKEIVPR